jgi:hypothetical protein
MVPELKQWWDSNEFKDLSDQMKYAKSCSEGGDDDPVDFTSTTKETIANCPEFMEAEDM